MSKVVVLSGGVGGAKLTLGMYHEAPAGTLTAVVNTGDDFEHLDLRICPDIDTILYTLADLQNREQGWGRRDETWTFMKTLATIGGETWFQLGDGDLALHVERTRRLRRGDILSAVTADVARSFGITAAIVPMSETAMPTMVLTPDGEISFQDYFVRLRCAPQVLGLRASGSGAEPAEGVRRALADPELTAIVIAPSNPYLSIDPILAVPQMKALLKAAKAPIVAVTPIIGGQAVKGPTAKIMAEFGKTASPMTVAAHYDGLIDGFVLDSRDAALASHFDISVKITDTLMTNLDDKRRVARAALDLCAELAA